MPRAPARILHQDFLPPSAPADAYVWKYTPVIGGRRPRHIHVEPELNLIAHGSASFGVGETIVRVSAGELIGFPAGQDHALLDASPDLFLFAIGVTPSLATDVLRDASGGASVPLHLRLPAHEFEPLIRHAEACVDRLGMEQPCAELWERVHALGQRTKLGRNGTMHVLTRRALCAIDESPELGLEQLAKQLRVNASEVSRYFHRDLGMTFVRYRARLRLLRFIHLVDQGRGNWLRAANAAGFGSYSQCHRTFQSEFGCPPKEFFLAGVRDEMQMVYDG